MVRSERARNIILPYCEVAAKTGTPEELLPALRGMTLVRLEPPPED